MLEWPRCAGNVNRPIRPINDQRSVARYLIFELTCLQTSLRLIAKDPAERILLRELIMNDKPILAALTILVEPFLGDLFGLFSVEHYPSG